MPLFGLFGPANVGRLRARRDVQGLIKALGYQAEPAVRSAAAEALYALRDPAGLQALNRALAGSDVGLRLAIAEALVACPPDDLSLPLLAHALQDPSPQVREVIIAPLRRADSPEALREAIVSAVDVGPSDGDALALLLPALQDPSVQVRRRVIAALRGMDGCEAQGGLLAALADADPEVRSSAAGALAACCTPEVIDRLTQALLADPDEKVRQEAAAALLRMLKEIYKAKDPAQAVDRVACALKQAVLKDTQSGELTSTVSSGADRLRSIGSGMPAELINCVLAAVIDLQLACALTAPKASIRADAVDYLRSITHQPAAAQVVEALIALVRNDSVDARRRAAYGLRDIARKQPRAAEGLRMALNDPDKTVREIAAEALQKVGDLPPGPGCKVE